ncbi:hypothetical protein AAMO2058_000411400 [Amorphochlora amoebiformis]
MRIFLGNCAESAMILLLGLCSQSFAAPMRQGGTVARLRGPVFARRGRVPLLGRGIRFWEGVGGGRNMGSIQERTHIPHSQIPFGDTGGSVVLMKDLLVGVGDSDLVRDVNVELLPGHRYGVIGQNGVGKSTLLKILTGELLPTDGIVRVDPKASVGYLKQTAVSGSTRTVGEEVRSQMNRLNQAKKNLDEAEKSIKHDPSGQNILMFEEAQTAFEQLGGYTVEGRVSRVLAGLGFSQSDHERPCSDFSGGWQMRIALARTLLSDPNLLILDEPTNHLDAGAKRWLAGYLSEFEGTLIVVSHDENLVRSACDRILEIEFQRLHEYRCGLDRYVGEKALRIKQQQAAFERQQEEIDKLEGFITKFGAKATKASAAESKKKQLAKIERIEAPVEHRKKTILKLPNPPPNDLRVASLEGASFGWGDKSLITGCNLNIEKGERWLILGENGAGKSTLMAALRGDLPLKEGNLYHSERTILGVFTQDLAQDLPQDKTAINHVLDTVQVMGSMTDEDGRKALGALGLSGPKALRKIGDLSGGEKARVALALLTLRPSNLMLLDEVTNHLDAGTVTTLCQALRNWKGSLAVITHDRDFARQINPTHVAMVTKSGKVETHDGGLYESDFAFMQEDVETVRETEKTTHEVREIKEEDKKVRRKKMNAPKRISKIETLLEGLDERLASIDEKMAEKASDMEELTRLNAERNAVQGEIDNLYAEWEELEEFLATV